MEHVLKYLASPMKVGVYNDQFRIDISPAEKLYRDLADIAKKHKVASIEFTKTAETIKNEELDGEEVIAKLSEGLFYLLQFNKCPKEVSAYLSAELPFVRYQKEKPQMPCLGQ